MRRVLLVASFHKWRNWGTKGYMTYPVTQLVSHRAGIWIREGRLLTMLFGSLSSTLDWSQLAWIGLHVSHWCLLSSVGPCPRQAPKVFIIIIILHAIHQVQLAWVFFLKYKSSLVISLLKPHWLSISPGSISACHKLLDRPLHNSSLTITSNTGQNIRDLPLD